MTSPCQLPRQLALLVGGTDYFLLHFLKGVNRQFRRQMKRGYPRIAPLPSEVRYPFYSMGISRPSKYQMREWPPEPFLVFMQGMTKARPLELAACCRSPPTFSVT